MNEAEQEQDAIVAWLKAQANRCLDNKRKHRSELTNQELKSLTGNEMAYRFAANRIANGDHHRPKDKDNEQP